MRKKKLIIGVLLLFIAAIIIVVWQSYASSPEYNFITAKLDIKNGNCRLIHTKDSLATSKKKAIEAIAAKYGFKNVYLEDVTPDEMNGINDYNKAMEIYLKVRNGLNWKTEYEKQVDSLYQ